jgi:hypothetical protein
MWGIEQREDGDVYWDVDGCRGNVLSSMGYIMGI